MLELGEDSQSLHEQVGAMIEAYASEQNARMTAMDNATTNAEEIIRSLTLLYNRVRQAAITTELNEVVSGAAAQE